MISEPTMLQPTIHKWNNEMEGASDYLQTAPNFANSAGNDVATL